jgi:hypothetical protein
MIKDSRIPEKVMYLMGYVDALEQENDLLMKRIIQLEENYDGMLTPEDIINQTTRWVNANIIKD